MIGQNMPHPWRGWIGWVFAHTAGCILGFGLLDYVLRSVGWLSLATPPTVQAIVYTLGAGLLGLCQWLLLGMHVSRWAAWTSATMLGFLAGDLGYQAIDGWLTSNVHVGEWAGFIVGFALIGVGVGSSQWLLMWRSFSRAGWWVPANMIGWTMGALAVITTQTVVKLDLWPVTFAAMLGIASGMVTGLCLVWLWQMSESRRLEYAESEM